MEILQKGNKGDEVLFLQRLLRKNYPSVEPDGDFGKATEAAVKKFQKISNLLVDGLVGPVTFDALSAKYAPDVFGTDIYRYDATEKDPFWEDLEKNYWFCFVKSSQGNSKTDPRFAEHFAGLKKRTILRGAYHFPLLLNPDVAGEVNCFLNACKEGGLNWTDKGVLPPVYDVEPLTEKQAEEFPKQRKDIVARMKKWLELVEKKTGRVPIIYTSQRVWDELLGSPKGFERYSLWVANYGTMEKPKMPSTWKAYAFWQFTDKGTIGGVKGFDVDKLGVTLADLLAMGGY